MQIARQRARELCAQIESLEVSLREARCRLRELENEQAAAAERFEDFELALPTEVSLAEILRGLSHQEQRVLRCYLEHANDKAVAKHMGKKLQTVRNQMSSIERKLSARGRSDLVIKVLTAYFEEKMCAS